jgi:hypothetical protein
VTRHLIAALVLALLPLAPPACAQSAPLRQLASHAGIIFSGQVEKIEREAPAAPGDVGVVRVTFRVVNALRGATPGGALTIAEWDGLWMSGDRYRAGENLLLFLFPPSGALGLTTTVGGPRGRIRLSDSPLSMASVARQIGATAAAGPGESEDQPWWLAKPGLRRRPLE